MAIFYGIDSNYANTLFSSLGNSNSGASGLTGLLSQYSSIKNGTYGKLLQKYYASDEVTSSNKTKNTNNTKKTYESDYDYSAKRFSTSTSKDSTKTLSAIETNTDNLKESADKLLKVGSNSVFQKVTKKDEDGNSIRAYDADKIYGAVKDFADNYNKVLSSASESNTASINRNVNSMKSVTSSNESLLSDIGISIDEKGQMSLDEEKFKKADMSTVKSLFNGTGSYAYQVSAKASMINFSAEMEANKANTYTNTGSYAYNFSNGDLYNSFF